MKTNKAFTLIELFVVIAIIFILGTMLLSAIHAVVHRGSNTQNSAPQTTTAPANGIVYTNLP